ncbi:serine-rich adhesin for platelets-like [Branchiostoma lanceolatum]|uniref:serine-rich adhesin for platelets-like n=1 Tax=Branchiostoma lanceolatum TaxID=7740 RepID=UPI0034522791
MSTSRRNRDSFSTEKSERKGKDGQERSVHSVQMRTKLSVPSLTTSRNVVHLQTAVPTRSVDTNRRDRRHKPHRSPWLSSDADSEDSSGDEGTPSRGRQRHRKPHSHRKKSSTSSAAHLPAVRSKKEKRRPSPPHVVLKLRRVASSPHPTAKGTASAGRHNKEYVVVRGNKSTGHGDTGSLEQRSSNTDESCREVRKVDGRRRISYEQYKANLKRSAVHKSKVVARATFVPSATAHTSEVSDETNKRNTTDRRSLSEEQRLAEVTARIRARNRAICPLTAEYSLKKMSIHPRRPTSSQLEATKGSETRQGLNARRTINSSSYPVVTNATGPTQSKPPSVGEDVRAKAVRHGHDVITYQPTSPRSRTGMTLADFVKMAKEKGGKDQILKTLAAQRASEKAVNSGRNGTRYAEPPGPHTACTAELGQKMPVSSTRPDGRHQHKLSQPGMPPSGQKNTAPPVVPPLSTVDRADRGRSGHDARAELLRPSRDPVWSRRDEGFRHQSQERVRAKNKVAHKSSTGGEPAKRPNSVLSCNMETDARRHDNGIGIKRADNVPQLTSQRKPLTSPPKPLMSPPTPLTSPPSSVQKVDALNDKNNSHQQVETCADSPVADEPAKRQHSVWSSDSESEESDDECWCMECFKSRIMGWSVPHVDKFAAMKQQASEDQTDTAVTASLSAGVDATAENEDSAETAVTMSTSSEITVPEKSHAVAMATTASSVTERYVRPTTEKTSAESHRHDSTGTAMSAPLVTPTAAVLSESAAPATVTQPLAPSTQEDQITLEEALATLLTTESEGSRNSKTTKQESTKRDTPSQECSEMNKNTTESPSSPSQEEWFKVFLDEAFGDFRPVSPTGSLHSSLFGSSKSSSENQAEISQDTTGQKKVRSSSESTQGSGSSSSSFRSSNDMGRARARRAASKKRARSRSDTSSGKSERGSTSGTITPSSSLSINDLSQRGDKITSPKKRARSSSNTSSGKSGRDSASTTTTSSPMSSNGKSRRGGKGTGPKKLARSSSNNSSSKDGRGSTGASSSSLSSLSICRKSRRGGKRAGPKKLALISSGTSSDKSGQGSTNTSTLPSVDKYSRRGGKRSCPKKRARSSSDASRDKSSRGSTNTTTSLSHLPSSDNQAYCGGTKKRARTALDGSAKCSKPPGQNKLMSMYYSCEPIDFFAPDEKRDDGDDGYETPWNFGVTPNLSLSRSDGGLWHSCKPVRSLSKPPPLPPPLYHPRPPGLEHIEDSPPPTSPGSPRHPEYPLRFGATGRSKPAHYYMAPYHRVGVLEHIGSPLQSTSTCPDHMVARYQNYLWIEPYDWEGTDMCDMFDATE